MRTIDADALYEQLQKDEELARKRVLDTESCLPYPNNLNPSYTRYVAQMDERTRLKHMVADAPTIEPERKKGEWLSQDHNKRTGYVTTTVYYYPKCSECGHTGNYGMNFCPNCGSFNGGDDEYLTPEGRKYRKAVAWMPLPEPYLEEGE